MWVLLNTPPTEPVLRISTIKRFWIFAVTDFAHVLVTLGTPDYNILDLRLATHIAGFIAILRHLGMLFKKTGWWEIGFHMIRDE
jgi:hypothetical protein